MAFAGVQRIAVWGSRNRANNSSPGARGDRHAAQEGKTAWLPMSKIASQETEPRAKTEDSRSPDRVPAQAKGVQKRAGCKWGVLQPERVKKKTHQPPLISEKAWLARVGIGPRSIPKLEPDPIPPKQRCGKKPQRHHREVKPDSPLVIKGLNKSKDIVFPKEMAAKSGTRITIKVYQGIPSERARDSVKRRARQGCFGD